MTANLWGVMYTSSKNSLLLAPLILLLSSCGNVLEDFPSKTSDSYLLDQSKKYIDENDYDSAIASIEPVLLHQPDNPEVVYVASVAYAGRGGLRILDLFENLVDGVATKGVLQIFAENFVDSTASEIADIERSMSVLESYGALAAGRTDNMNFFALFLFYSRIGVVLNTYAYDPVTDQKRSNFDACHTLVTYDAVKTGIANSEIDKIYTTIPRIVDTITHVAASGSGFDEIRAATSLMPAGLGMNPLPCSDTPNDANCRAVRTLINVGKSANGIGLESGVGVCVAVTP